MPGRHLTFIIPAFNEAGAINKVLRETLPVAEDVVVIDDGSADNTFEQAVAAGATAVRHSTNLGQGAAIQTGIEYAARTGATHVVTFDADGQHRVTDAIRMADRVDTENLDVVLGTRGSRRQPGMPLTRYLLIRGGLLYTRWTTGLPLTDTHNGLRVFTMAAAKQLHLTQSRMAHASEILDRIAALKLRWAEEPVEVSYTAYALSKGQTNWDAFNVMLDIVKARMGKTADRPQILKIRQEAIKAALTSAKTKTEL